LQVAIPVFSGSTTNISVDSNTTSSCSSMMVIGANCGPYTLIVSASNPKVGAFSAGTVTYMGPAAGGGGAHVRARLFLRGGGGSRGLHGTRRLLCADGGRGHHLQPRDEKYQFEFGQWTTYRHAWDHHPGARGRLHGLFLSPEIFML